MESNGVPGLVPLLSETHQIVGGIMNIFHFTCCGKINIKGKGEMMTFLARILVDERDDRDGDG